MISALLGFMGKTPCFVGVSAVKFVVKTLSLHAYTRNVGGSSPSSPTNVKETLSDSHQMVFFDDDSGSTKYHKIAFPRMLAASKHSCDH